MTNVKPKLAECVPQSFQETLTFRFLDHHPNGLRSERRNILLCQACSASIRPNTMSKSGWAMCSHAMDLSLHSCDVFTHEETQEVYSVPKHVSIKHSYVTASFRWWRIDWGGSWSCRQLYDRWSQIWLRRSRSHSFIFFNIHTLMRWWFFFFPCVKQKTQWAQHYSDPIPSKPRKTNCECSNWDPTLQPALGGGQGCTRQHKCAWWSRHESETLIAFQDHLANCAHQNPHAQMKALLVVWCLTDEAY